MASIQSTVCVAPGVLFNRLDGEAVLLNVTTGKYFGLNDVATRMWELLAEHGSVADTCQALQGEYAVGAEQLERDLLTLVDALAAQSLVSVEQT